ncbi:MAG TPA: alpha/beta hydrolase [Chthoniobacteraceae bacterium]|jgi:pimeloyl-ACP methyl ester carboxylesterase|nr:alpha/beta hydrolase [Chthoniobacteraceae bacterium]
MEKRVTLVILPGLDGTEIFFRPFLAALPAWVQPLMVSYPVTGPNGYEDLLKVVRGAVAGLSEFFVLGSSFSGPLAVMLAAEEPVRVRGVILSATFLRMPRKELLKYKPIAVWPVIWTVRAMRRAPVLLRPRDDPYRRAKAETWRRVSARCLAARVRALMTVDAREIWQKCAQPALNMTYDVDGTVPHVNAEEIQHLRPETERIMISGGHLSMSQHPAKCAEAASGFIRRHAGGNGSALNGAASAALPRES